MSQQNYNLAPLKAALYVRLSREDRDKIRKEDDSESIVNQQNMLINYCKENGIEIYNIYNDEDYSGSDRERPAFNRMIADAENHKFNIILCKTQSRFARDLELVEKYINTLFPIWGIRFIGVVDNADSTNKYNRKQRQITSLVDQWYLEDLSDNIKATLASKRKQGLWVGAFAPYGYKKDPENKNHLLVDEEAAKTVRYVFLLYLQGLGITTIARKLNEEGIPNPAIYKQQHGQPFENAHKDCSDLWHTYSIGRMLSNMVYLGCVVQGMTENISYKSQKKRKKPKDEWDIVENAHDPIVDRETWERVQQLRESKPRVNSMGLPNIFARKVQCLKCGKSMRIYYTRHERYFRCHTNFIATDRCPGTYVSEKVLKREVLKQIQNLYRQHIDEEYVLEQTENIDEFAENISALKAKIDATAQLLAKLEKRLKNLYLDKIDEVISREDYLVLSEECKAQKKTLEETIQKDREALDVFLQQSDASTHRLDTIRQFKNIQDLDRSTVNILIDHIEVGGSKNHRIINIFWNV